MNSRDKLVAEHKIFVIFKQVEEVINDKNKVLDTSYAKGFARIAKVVKYVSAMFNNLDIDLCSTNILHSAEQKLVYFLHALNNFYENPSENTLIKANSDLDFFLKEILPLQAFSIPKTKSSITNFVTEYNDVYQELLERFKGKVDADLSNVEHDVKSICEEAESGFERITELEKTYKEKLKLEEPATYWKERADKLRKEGWLAVKFLIGLVLFACVTLYLLLWWTPEGMFNSFTKGTESGIRWTILFITFLSFLAYGVKVLSKVTFSSFHLARDAEEREKLTFFYLALLKDSTVNDEDRALVLQSLFSRAETGLLKDDGAPVMPSMLPKNLFGSR